MSERLRHLRRQQALLQEHLAWLESEIAREEPSPAPPQAPTPPPPPAFAPDADALIERYGRNERHAPTDVRRGCLIAFVATLALLVGGVTAIWLVYYRR